MSEITPAELAEWRKAWARTSKGEWYIEQEGDVTVDIRVRNGPESVPIADCVFYKNAEFIIAARTAMPRLLDRVEELEGELGWLAKSLSEDADSCSCDWDNESFVKNVKELMCKYLEGQR